MSEAVFTDEQVTRACNLHIDNLRRLITWGAVKPVQAGGGRGRVRKWTARQGLRISVTAQFVDAGFSLQMAHTLTYCLPLDDFLHVYDPHVIRSHLKGGQGLATRRLRAMLSPRGKNYWPTKRYLCSEVFIVDKRYLYADVLGDQGLLCAIIDTQRQCVYPNFLPSHYYEGMGVVDSLNLSHDPDITKISRRSLLIDDEFLGSDYETHHERFQQHLPPGIDSQVISIGGLVCRNLSLINLAVGLTEFVRKLLGLPVDYHPFEESNL